MLLGQEQAAEHPRKMFVKLTESAELNRDLTSGLLGLVNLDAILLNQSASSAMKAFPDLKRAGEDPYGLNRVYVVEFDRDQNVSTLSRALSDIGDIEYAEPIYLRELYETEFIPNDPYYSSSWHHSTIESAAAWDIETGSDSIIVAIIDTGVDTDHPDLVDNLWINANEIEGNGLDDDGNGVADDYYGYDFSGSESNTNDDPNINHDWGWHPWNAEDHGTHCAGIAAAVTDNGAGVAGMSHHSLIMGVKIFPNAWDDVCADAIIYAADNGAQILSNSWGGGGNSSTIQDAILYARNVQDAVVLFASGNDGSSTAHYPGANSGTVCVGATNVSDGRASFSNYGSWVDMCAPGTGIWSCTDPDNPAHNSNYQAWDGTSMATPLAAGVGALIRAHFPGIDAAATEERLLDGDYVGNLQMGNRVNAFKALTAFQISHDPMENTIDQANDYEIQATIFSGEPDGLTVDLYYALSGSAYTHVGMTNTDGDDWLGFIPAQPGGTVVEYYIHAHDSEGNEVYHPVSAPDLPFFFLVGGMGHFTTLAYDDAEEDLGWSLGIAGDAAESGVWERVDPIGTYEDGVPVQPEDDHSDPGTLCFVTGNAPFDGDNSGENDVDYGPTTLESPVFNIPGGTFPVLSYWRWFTNDLGFNPGSDPWRVQIKNGSSDWLDLEFTIEAANYWQEKQFVLKRYFENPTQIQLRFIAHDQDLGSLVEAAVDDVRIFVAGGSGIMPGDVNFDAVLNIQDIILLVAHILGESVLTGDAALAADHNLDGQTNVQDLVTLVSVILN